MRNVWINREKNITLSSLEKLDTFPSFEAISNGIFKGMTLLDIGNHSNTGHQYHFKWWMTSIRYH